MEYLQTLLDNSEIPIITAFLLGLLTAVSPCPLATNITAIGFISKDINNRNRIFTNGILYTLGRVLAYSVLGAILIAILRKGADMFAIQKGISEWGELLLAPALMLIGLFMLFGDKLQLPKFGFSATEKTEKLKGSWGSLLLGIFIIRKSKFPQNPKRSVRFSGKRTKRSVQKRKARNTQKAETKVL